MKLTSVILSTDANSCVTCVNARIIGLPSYITGADTWNIFRYVYLNPEKEAA